MTLNIRTLRWLLLLVPGIWAGTLPAQATPEAVMRSASEAYANGDFARSATLLDSLYREGYESVALCYNLGNAWFKQGKTGPAVLWYERALLLDPGSEDAAFNLRLAQARVVDRVASPPEFVLKKWFRESIQNRSAGGWAWIALVLGWLAAGAGVAFFFVKQEPGRRIAFFGGIIAISLSLLMLGFSLRQRARLRTATEAVVMAPNVYVKSAPSETGADVFIVHEGLKVTLQETRGEWVRIRLADGKTGWARGVEVEGI